MAGYMKANKASDGDPLFQSISNLTSPSSSQYYSQNNLETASRPSYMVELLPAIKANDGSIAADAPPPKATLYRVTAYGEGKTNKAITIVQSIYRR